MYVLQALMLPLLVAFGVICWWVFFREGLAGATYEATASLKPAFLPEGKVTAGNSSQICDGAAAMLIMSEEKAKELGLKPRARFHTFALAGVDPVTMLTGPIPATAKAAATPATTPSVVPRLKRSLIVLGTS